MPSISLAALGGGLLSAGGLASTFLGPKAPPPPPPPPSPSTLASPGVAQTGQAESQRLQGAEGQGFEGTDVTGGNAGAASTTRSLLGS